MYSQNVDYQPPLRFPDIIPELTPLDVERLKHSVTRTLKGMESRMPDFVKLLSDPPRVSFFCIFKNFSLVCLPDFVKLLSDPPRVSFFECIVSFV